MNEDYHTNRMEITKEITELLDTVCKPCGGTHQERENTKNLKSCRDCPILHDLQERGKLLEEMQKKITISKVDINNLTNWGFYYLNTIKEYTVPEIADAYQITVHRLNLLIDK